MAVQIDQDGRGGRQAAQDEAADKKQCHDAVHIQFRGVGGSMSKLPSVVCEACALYCMSFVCLLRLQRKVWYFC